MNGHWSAVKNLFSTVQGMLYPWRIFLIESVINEVKQKIFGKWEPFLRNGIR